MSPSINPKIKSADEITFLKSDFLITCLFFEKLNSFKTKKLVLMQHPEKEEKVIRLLIGLPGDWVKSKTFNVYHRIPEGHCWVECLKGEDDSTKWGPVY